MQQNYLLRIPLTTPSALLEAVKHMPPTYAG